MALVIMVVTIWWGGITTEDEAILTVENDFIKTLYIIFIIYEYMRTISLCPKSGE